MCQYFVGVSQGILGNLLTAAIFILLWYAWMWLPHRQLRAFFGITDERKLIIFTSTLFIPAGGSVGAGGIQRSYEGPAVPVNEAMIWGRLASLFEAPLSKLGLAKVFSSMFLKRGVVEQAASWGSKLPTATAASFITLGSPGYNDISGDLQKYNLLAWINAQGSSTSFKDGSTDSNPRHAFIQRVILPGTNQVGLYVAGLSTLGTTAACSHLIRNWRALHRQVKKHEQICWMIDALDDTGERTTVLKVIAG